MVTAKAKSKPKPNLAGSKAKPKLAVAPTANVTAPSSPGEVRPVASLGAGAAFESIDPRPRSQARKRLRHLSPIATVRIRGWVTRRGARINLLTARVPRGTTVTVRCRGGGCPSRVQRRSVAATAQAGGRAVQVLRFRRLERELRAGTVLDVVVTRDGWIGKFTRFRIRARRVPTRQDLCLPPGEVRPVTSCS